jgi:hypothetical protein
MSSLLTNGHDVQVVRTFLNAGVASQQIGIICLFRAQVCTCCGAVVCVTHIVAGNNHLLCPGHWPSIGNLMPAQSTYLLASEFLGVCGILCWYLSIRKCGSFGPFGSAHMISLAVDVTKPQAFLSSRWIIFSYSAPKQE